MRLRKSVVKKKFQKKAKKAYDLCIDAIKFGDSDSAHDKWKKVYGRPFPANPVKVNEASANKGYPWRNTEEFIEDSYPVDIRYNLKIDCDVSQAGFRTQSLRAMLASCFPLLAQKKLLFRICENDVPEPYVLKWKVLNRGDIAQKKDMVRGQIVSGNHHKEERTSFKGEHLVECYIVKDGVVVAKSSIDVPIATGE